jgi:2-keto-4-pentenoate hydratase
MGHPFEALAWLGNRLAARGRTLAAGSIVMTGSVVPPQWPGPGDELVVRVDGLGEARARFT